MSSTFVRRAAWSTLAAIAPCALYAVTNRSLRIPRVQFTLSEEDLLDDLFEGEVAASSL